MVDRCNDKSPTQCSSESEIDAWTRGKSIQLRALNIKQDLDPHEKHTLGDSFAGYLENHYLSMIPILCATVPLKNG
jgi:hypothetical protein